MVDASSEASQAATPVAATTTKSARIPPIRMFRSSHASGAYGCRDRGCGYLLLLDKLYILSYAFVVMIFSLA